MTPLTLAAIAGLGLVAAAAPGMAQEIGDPMKGAQFARAACYQCHAVEKGQARSPNPDAPSFSRIAADNRMTALALHVWFQSPHPTMPNLVLGEYDKANLVAYILSLKQVRHRPR
jgi:mono/diheme cytochrome c family protein